MSVAVRIANEISSKIGTVEKSWRRKDKAETNQKLLRDNRDRAKPVWKRNVFTATPIELRRIRRDEPSNTAEQNTKNENKISSLIRCATRLNHHKSWSVLENLY